MLICFRRRKRARVLIFMTASLVMLWVQQKTLAVHWHGRHIPGTYLESDMETGRTLLYKSESISEVADAKMSEDVHAETLHDLKSVLAKTHHNNTVPLNLSRNQCFCDVQRIHQEIRPM